jgi:hypothetical protein
MQSKTKPKIAWVQPKFHHDSCKLLKRLNSTDTFWYDAEKLRAINRGNDFCSMCWPKVVAEFAAGVPTASAAHVDVGIQPMQPMLSSARPGGEPEDDSSDSSLSTEDDQDEDDSDEDDEEGDDSDSQSDPDQFRGAGDMDDLMEFQEMGGDECEIQISSRGDRGAEENISTYTNRICG